MLKRTSTIIFFFILSLSFFAIYQYFKIPEGVTPQSGNPETIAWLSFWTSIVALVTAIVGLIEKIIRGRKADD